MAAEKKEAPGAPGIAAKWTSSSKSGIGKALDTASDVTFTLSHGILNEIYYPREDIACIRDMGMIVTDGHEFFSEEKRHAHHSIQMLGDSIPAYQIINSCFRHQYIITKEIIADPFRDAVLQKTSLETTFTSEHPLHLYVLLAPHLNDQGDHNTGWLDTYKGMPMLFAQNGDLTLALACSVPWLKRSVGYVGVSDGWTDLHQHKQMEWDYTHASDGNIALTAEIDFSGSSEFVLAIGFGRNPSEAASHARTCILDGFDSAKKWYIENWGSWLESLEDVECADFKISAAVLRINEAKSFPGGIIASLSIPWGETKGDADESGYHVVWPRDLVESAGGFLALKTPNDTLRIVNYLMATQEADGSWPQNMWLEGVPHWNGVQMDQMALPIILLDKCARSNAIDAARMARYWPLVKKTISYILHNGPYSPQDRWEEESGLSTFTLATEIAALLAAADLAEANQENQLAIYCRETADYWNDNIENWTYATGTALADKVGVEGYYIRINPYLDIPAAELGDRTIFLKNHSGETGNTLLTELICMDALALVRFGLRDPHDPRMLNTIKVIDAKLKVSTPHGDCWHRYSNDGYGEHDNGDAYDGTGIGRAWPLLTGERGHYEVAAGNIAGAKKLAVAMEGFSNHGLLPEQIWDTEDIPEKGLFLGKHTGSAMPLTWAHAEYIKLCASIKEEQVFDMPPHTQERYLKNKTSAAFQTWTFQHPRKQLEAGKSLRIEVRAEAVVYWTSDNWATCHETPTRHTGIGLYVADIATEQEQCEQLIFTFRWSSEGNWENTNFTVERILQPILVN